VLFNSRRWELVSTAVHHDTRLERGRHKPVLEVRLRGSSTLVAMLVVHLKSGSDGREIRERQLHALAAVIARVGKRGDRVVVLGDFNATERADRDDLADLARETGLVWASEPLACSAFWSRTDGCPRSRLDHVLTWMRPRSIVATGACATDGCDWQRSCPLYVRDVSDHCPVVVTVD
jgi:endonuclease/exonuclease/phosphatase family metal-dependent hydrolase